MFRYLVLFSFCLLVGLSGVAQNLAEELAGNPPDNANQRTKKVADARSVGPTETRISVRRLNVPRKARQLYEKALEAWSRQARADAQQKLDQALHLDPTFPEALTLLGGIHAADQQWNSAERSLQAAIRSDPSFFPAYVILAGVYNSQDRYDEAQDATERALSAGAETWCVQYEIARALIGKGQYENALAISDAALLSKHGSLMHLARAHAMLGLRKYPEAAAELRTYLSDDPSGDGSQDARILLERLQSFVSR